VPMADGSLESLLRLHGKLADDFQELREGILKAIRLSEQDSEMALTRVRKVLELVVCDVFQTRYREAAGTRPLENLLQRLIKDGHLPMLLAANANHIRELGNIGTHRHGERVTARDVQRSLDDLLTILEWYTERVRPDAVRKRESPLPDAGQQRDHAASPADPLETVAANPAASTSAPVRAPSPKASPAPSRSPQKDLHFYAWYFLGVFAFVAAIVVLGRTFPTVGTVVKVGVGVAAVLLVVCMYVAVALGGTAGRKR